MIVAITWAAESGTHICSLATLVHINEHFASRYLIRCCGAKAHASLLEGSGSGLKWPDKVRYLLCNTISPHPLPYGREWDKFYNSDKVNVEVLKSRSTAITNRGTLANTS